MAVTARKGKFAIGLQNAKVGDSTFNPATHVPGGFYEIPALRIGFGALQDVQVFPPETGGPLTPHGVYKQMYMAGGQVDLLPRLDGTFGILAKAALGAASTVTGTPNTHLFRFASEPDSIPWVALRKLIPGNVAADYLGETVYDGKCAGLRITVPALGKLGVTASFLAREFRLEENPSWSFGSANNATDSAPEAGRGYFKIDGVSYPLAGVVIDLANQLSTPQQNMAIGRFSQDDIVVLGRAVTVRAAYRYEDPDLYQKLLTGSASGTTWDSAPFATVTGANKALEVFFEAPGVAGGSTKYSVKIVANHVVWATDGSPELVPGGFIVQNLIGTVVSPSSGDYVTIELKNSAAAAMYS